jgi:hypothetical protein
VISARNEFVFEVGEDEGGPGDFGGLVGAGGDALEGFPAGFEEGEAAFADGAQGSEQGVAGAGVDVEDLGAG